MIKLESSKMQKAIATAKQVRPRVRRIGERKYSVTGRCGNVYTVRFMVVNGLKLAECDCPAGQAHALCYHICAAAALNIAVHSIYSKPSESPKASADDRAAMIAEIEAAWDRKYPHQPLGLALLRHFSTNQLNDLANDFLRKIHEALRR